MLHDLENGQISRCQICLSPNLKHVLDLGYHPPCDSLLTPDQLKEPEITYPLRLVYCQNCSLSQIDYVVAPEVLFYKEYPYRSGITESLKNNLMAISDKLVDQLNLKPSDLVIDIGSNDGTILQGFKNKGIRVLGVEPTNIANVAIQNGIDTINEFFTEELAKKIQFKFNDILAALVMVQLEKLPDRLEKAKNDFQLYFDGMKSIKHIHFFKTDIENGTVPLWVDALVDGDRDVFIKNMRKKYRMSPILPSIHLQDVYSKEEKLHLPSSEKIADKGLWFPSGAGKGREDIERVIQATKEFFE